MLNIKKVLGVITLIIIILLICYLIYYYYYYNRYILLSKSHNATKEKIIAGNKILSNKLNSGLSFCLSCWIYIDNWDYLYNYKKIIIFWKGSDIEKRKCKKKKAPPSTYIKPTKSPSIFPIVSKCQDDCPNLLEDFSNKILKEKGMIISLDSNDNNILVSMSLIDNSTQTIIVDNIPIQKWINLSINVYLRNIDIFINARLVKAVKLRNLPTRHSGNIILTPDMGFEGFINKLYYFNTNIKIGKIRKLFLNGPK